MRLQKKSAHTEWYKSLIDKKKCCGWLTLTFVCVCSRRIAGTKALHWPRPLSFSVVGGGIWVRAVGTKLEPRKTTLCQTKRPRRRRRFSSGSVDWLSTACKSFGLSVRCFGPVSSVTSLAWQHLKINWISISTTLVWHAKSYLINILARMWWLEIQKPKKNKKKSSVVFGVLTV